VLDLLDGALGALAEIILQLAGVGEQARHRLATALRGERLHVAAHPGDELLALGLDALDRSAYVLE
jgi:hypothetical protein